MKVPTVKVIEVEGSLGDVVRKHPAFGRIRASRCSGYARLYGSPLRHNGYVEITLELSEEHVSHTHSHYFSARGESLLARVSMSEAQWAAFISTMNVGEGVPVTLEYIRTGDVERMPLVEDEAYDDRRAKDIESHVQKQNEQLKKAVAKLDEIINHGGSVSRKALKELRSLFIQPVDNAPRNASFLAEMLTEHSEKLVEKAKAEVSSMVTRMHMQFPQISDCGVEIVRPLIEDKRGQTEEESK